MQWNITIFDLQWSIYIMIKQVSKTFVAGLAMLLLMTGATLYGQQQPVEMQELKDSSLSSFNQGKFRAALSGFRSLMEIQGADPLFSYYTGRCLVELNEELDKVKLIQLKGVPRGRPDFRYHAWITH